MQSKFLWLSADTVVEINKLVVAEEGEPHLLVDSMKLEAALQRPYNLWSYEGVEDAFCLSVGYMVSIAQAHPFIQGNKRTSFIAGRGFLQNHGYDLVMPDLEATAKLFIEVIEHRKEAADFETHLERFVVPLEP